MYLISVIYILINWQENLALSNAKHFNLKTNILLKEFLCYLISNFKRLKNLKLQYGMFGMD